MVSSGHVTAVAFLDVLGLCLNVWFLYTVKARQSPYNAIDALQAVKTLLVILALLCSVWLDLVTCSDANDDTSVLVCIGAKAIIENLLFHSVCYTFLSVACIRRKVCKCRGRADVLVTTKYALKTLALALTPVWMFIAATISLVSNYGHYVTSDHGMNVTSGEGEFDQMPNTIRDLMLSEYSRIIYQLCHTAILNLIPLVTSFVMYINIVYTVKKIAEKTDDYVSQRSKSPTKAITVSVVTLLTCTCSLWSIYTVTSIVAIFVGVTPSIFTFLKLAILIIHPFGEGLLQSSARKQGGRVNRTVPERLTRQICPHGSASMSSIRDDDGVRSVAEYLPTLIEERSSIRQSEDLQQYKNHVKIPSAPKVLTPRTRRESTFHPRPSVLMKHAPVIGLEYREEPTILALTKKRRESEERLKQGLKHIEEDKVSQTSYRKLSRCLRLSSSGDFHDEDIYDEYRKRYSTDFRKPMKEMKASPSSALEEYKGLAYAKNRNVEGVTSSPIPVCLSPSQMRWRKLLTTTKTARQFYLKQKPLKPIDDEQLSINGLNADTSTTHGADPSRHKEHSTVKGYKKRSMSTSKNAWLMGNSGRPRERERNKSVSFISNIVLDSNAPCSSSDYSRSFSCDAKISVNYRNDAVDLGLNPKKRSKEGRSGRGKTENIPWVVTENTTREECIQKLQQWNDYF